MKRDKVKELERTVEDLRAAIRYATGPLFAPPDDAASRLAWLRGWWDGERMRMEGKA